MSITVWSSLLGGGLFCSKRQDRTETCSIPETDRRSRSTSMG